MAEALYIKDGNGTRQVGGDSSVEQDKATLAAMTASINATKADLEALNAEAKDNLDRITGVADVIRISQDYNLRDTIFPNFEVVTVRPLPNHDMTFINGNLWVWDKPSEGGLKILNPTDWSLVKAVDCQLYETHKDGSTPELQMKSCDFNPENNVLMVGNGKAGYKGTDGYLYMFYDAVDWENATNTVTFDNCGEYTKIDVSELGGKIYGYWAAPNLHNNEIFVSCNTFGDIYRLRLGKGTTQLSSGIYTKESNLERYNGTYEILKHWIMPVKNLGGHADHGGQFYKGYLYLGNNASDVAQIYRVALRPNGTFAFDVLDMTHFMDDGNYSYAGIDGLAIRDGKIYAHPLNSNEPQKLYNLMKIELPV